MSGESGKVLQLHQYGGHAKYRRDPVTGEYYEVRPKLHNGREDIHKAILKGEAFRAGAMTGTTATQGIPTWGYGRLDDKYRASVQQADYIVWSYGTPIAWHINDECNQGWWVMPDDTYSNTTNRHQGIVRVALSLATVLPYDEDPSERTET